MITKENFENHEIVVSCDGTLISQPDFRTIDFYVNCDPSLFGLDPDTIENAKEDPFDLTINPYTGDMSLKYWEKGTTKPKTVDLTDEEKRLFWHEAELSARYDGNGGSIDPMRFICDSYREQFGSYCRRNSRRKKRRV